MKISVYRTRFVSSISVLALISGCAVEQKKPEVPKPKPIVVPIKVAPVKIPDAAANTPPSPAQTALNDGVALYEQGEFIAAIKRLGNASEIWISDNKQIKLSAFKYLAFSYCVTAQNARCKKEFEKAVDLDPAFDLAPGEKGHPLWGPVFEKVQKAKAGH